ncbi:LysR family transcriptional regulator [Acuticoccus kandeliae]|uniref:LysR family transcriptional regulator n=1 Tax=Acuticoccus kandeliae TaxID=2073160 RepID=UPI000D3E0CA6|nr:LysR family transcriptional regulator [Acuticoccus kandeliae]
MESNYRSFAEVVKHGSIRQAADAMHMSASSVSRQIRQLEHAFDTQLLVRNTQGVRLTPAGEVLARFVRTRSRETQRLQAAIDALKGLRVGHLSIYTVEGTIGGLLQNALARFSTDYPEITYDVVVAGTDDVARAVEDDRCELGILFYPHPRPGIAPLLRMPAPLFAVVAPDHRLAGQASVSLAEIAMEPVGLPNASFGIRHLVDHIVKANNIELKIRLETNSIDMVRQFAIRGMGVTLLPGFGIERELQAGSLVALPLKEGEVSQSTMQVVKRTGVELSPVANRFVSVVADHVGPEGVAQLATPRA